MLGPARNKYLPQDEMRSYPTYLILLISLYIWKPVFDLLPIIIHKKLFLSQKMICFPSSCCLPLQSSSTISNTRLRPPLQLIRRTSIKLKAAGSDTPQVDYNSMASSVFPAEACETVGGVACDVEMFPETKLKQPPQNLTTTKHETVDREYVDYNGPKTVFISEACDDLGGEFCDADST